MHKPLFAAILMACSSLALAQLPGSTVQRSSSPRGMQIQGDAPSSGATSSPVGSSIAATAASAPSATTTRGESQEQGGTQIQGNTRITASGVNTSTTAVGKGNTARSAVGSIGGGN